MIIKQEFYRKTKDFEHINLSMTPEERKKEVEKNDEWRKDNIIEWLYSENGEYPESINLEKWKKEEKEFGNKMDKWSCIVELKNSIDNIHQGIGTLPQWKKEIIKEVMTKHMCAELDTELEEESKVSILNKWKMLAEVEELREKIILKEINKYYRAYPKNQKQINPKEIQKKYSDENITGEEIPL